MTAAHTEHRTARRATHAALGNGSSVATLNARSAKVAAPVHREAGPRMRLGSRWHTASTLHAAPRSATVGSATIISAHAALRAPHARVNPHSSAARTACETGVSNHRARKLVGSKAVPLLGESFASAEVASFVSPAPSVGAVAAVLSDEAATSASSCSRSDTYCRAKAETRRATTVTVAPPTAMVASSAETFTATLSHACRIRGMGRAPQSRPRDPCPALRAPSRRVQDHALTSPFALAPRRGERVAWPTVPADGSPHLHSVPSDVGFAQASGPLESSATS